MGLSELRLNGSVGGGRTWGMAALLLGLGLTQPALAVVSSASRGVFTGTVEVSGKTPGTYTIWQSTTPGGNEYVDTGYTVTVGANGRGSADIPNVASGTLLKGHNVKIGDDNNPNGQAPKAVSRTFMGWLLSSADPGLNQGGIAIAQSHTDPDGNTHMQTWESGTIMTFSLNPGQATWVNQGASVHGNGLALTLLGVTPTQVTVRVDNDSSVLTPDDIQISGVGLNVTAAPGSVIQVGFTSTGSTNTYLNGQWISSNNWSIPQSYMAQSISISPEPGSIALLTIGAALGLLRRR